MTVASAWLQRQDNSREGRDNDLRHPYQRDKARVLHSAAFRRLQAKTQVMYIGMHDFPRTRLTHSLEAAQIGTGLVSRLRQQQAAVSEQLGLSKSLIESLCLAHDIGHPPYGHGGEIALHYMMRNSGGFEGNGQTFRIVTQLEPYTQHNGMNLCRRTLLGLLKYPVLQSQLVQTRQPAAISQHQQLDTRLWHPPKALFDDDSDYLDWVLAPLSDSDRQQFQQLSQQPSEHQAGRSRHKSVDASIMEIADDIAYAVHDLEDAIVVGLIQREQWQQLVLPELEQLMVDGLTLPLHELTTQLFSGQHFARKNAIGALVNHLVNAVDLIPNTVVFDEPLLAWTASLGVLEQRLLHTFKQFVFYNVIRRPDMQVQEFKGQQIVMALFEVLSVDPLRLLPHNTAARYRQAEADGSQPQRIIADYLAGMTDAYAARLHQDLFSPGLGSFYR
ncbi:anti-phage deoxyguanosine triphosphatase [Idiomarina xiamenensis]|uniref:Deoxyguanosinetriphosphate triphosphohydrolase-like protein n=1 Tax=Idiomarina xiamenensis 10-D-4 TaxID=740709 RepID=K2KQQ4_9GAMM|nr:anti-phage deoxyguanosine triphosphatase [Idiomarina xiamenensis]EKE84779.1 deoxyguanosinetriphosphate triphosphohydrolase-like protein [Idiomarina xiamenensis 10-D-4]